MHGTGIVIPGFGEDVKKMLPREGKNQDPKDPVNTSSSVGAALG